MKTSDKIRILLIRRNMKVKDLAQVLGCTQSNASQKLKRDNFSEQELNTIAEALNCTYRSVFVLKDTGEEL